VLLLLSCTDFTKTSYIRLKPESEKRVRVYLGHQEARKIFSDKDYESIIASEMQKLGYCSQGYKYVQGSLSGSGQGLQCSYVVKCN